MLGTKLGAKDMRVKKTGKLTALQAYIVVWTNIKT